MSEADAREKVSFATAWPIYLQEKAVEGRRGGGGGGGVDVAVDRLELGPRTTLLIVFATAFERSENETQEMRAAATAPSRIRGFLLLHLIFCP